MDLTKLESIIEAIRAEAKMPAPSHANLARLVAMAFEELISARMYVVVNETQTVGTTTNGTTESWDD